MATDRKALAPAEAGGAATALDPGVASFVPSAGAYERLRILLGAKTIAMVGLSADPMRPSHFAAIYMQSEGYDIVPVNPRYVGGEILGQTVYASLAEIERPVDIVDVFRKPEEAPALAEQAADRQQPPQRQRGRGRQHQPPRHLDPRGVALEGDVFEPDGRVRDVAADLEAPDLEPCDAGVGVDLLEAGASVGLVIPAPDDRPRRGAEGGDVDAT